MKSQIVRWSAKPITVLISLGISFFGSLVLAALLYPRVYDWRQTVISSLASPRDNPRAYWIACAGMAASALLLLPFEVFLRRRLEPFSARCTIWAGKLFLLGAVFLELSALIVPGHYRILGIGNIHQHVSHVSIIAFCLSFLLYFKPILCLPRSFFWLQASAMFLVVFPDIAFDVSRVSLFLASEFCSSTIYHTIEVSLWSSLALWEWIGAFCFYLFLGLITLGLPETNMQSNAEEEQLDVSELVRRQSF